MKYIYLIIIVLLVISCSNRNELVTKLMNEKKVIEDSIDMVQQMENYYNNKARKEVTLPNDTMSWKLSSDSAGTYFGKSLVLKDKLKAINFSLDSLSRMK